MNKQKIGTITLREKKTFTNLYETAAWFQTIDCEPQTVDLFILSRSDGRPYFIGCVFHGVITGENFQSLFGGVPIGKAYRSERLGQPGRHSFTTDSYNVARLDRRFFDVQLVEGVVINHVDDYDNGEPMLRLEEIK